MEVQTEIGNIDLPTVIYILQLTLKDIIPLKLSFLFNYFSFVLFLCSGIDARNVREPNEKPFRNLAVGTCLHFFSVLH